jgi:hypothetical protein
LAGGLKSFKITAFAGGGHVEDRHLLKQTNLHRSKFWFIVAELIQVSSDSQPLVGLKNQF